MRPYQTAIMKFLVLSMSLLAVSCAGYRLGASKPATLEHVRFIAVPMFDNVTLHPRAEAIATSAVASAFVRDGTYRISSIEKADAILEGKLSTIKYSAIRGTRLDTMLPEEIENSATIDWILKDAKNPTKVLAAGSSTGTSQLFVSSNLQTARNNALPEALERAGATLVSTLANGY